MRCYITGVAGLLGSNLAKELLKKGYEVKGCDSLIGGYKSNIPHMNWSHIDILNNEKLSASMKGYDTVIHCAALPYEGLSIFSPKLITESIYTGTISVASAAIANNYKLFINMSSMARYGVGNPPFKETDIVKPVDPYGLAKIHAEEALTLLSDIHGLKIYTCVPHNIVGPGQKYDDVFRNVAAIFANKILRDKKVFIYGSGEQLRSFSHIDSCIDAIYKLIKIDKFSSGEVFNIGPQNTEITIKELAEKIAYHCNIPLNIEYLPKRPCEVKYAYCSSEKAIKELNYNPNIKNIDEIIIDLITYIKTRGSLPFDYHLNLEIVDERTPKTWFRKDGLM